MLALFYGTSLEADGKLSMRSIVAADHEDPSAEDLMRQGAVNYKALLLPVRLLARCAILLSDV